MKSNAGNARHGGLPEVRVLEVQGVGGHGGVLLYLALYGQVKALLGVGHHHHPAGEQLPLLSEDGLGPVGEGLDGGRAQPHHGVQLDEGDDVPLSLGRADVDVNLDKDADVSDAQKTVLDLTMSCLKYSGSVPQ